MSRIGRSKLNVPKFIMVTGAAGGIGGATVSRLVDAGHVVFAAARQADLRTITAQHPELRPIELDVTDRSSIGHAVDRVQAATGGFGLDVLVNVAGNMILGPVEAVPDELVRHQFEVNVFGLLAVTRVFLPAMRERGSGRIVNVSSVLGRLSLPGSGVYASSKFAVEAISDALRIEVAPFGVRVVLVEPGVIDTPLYGSAALSLPLYDDALEPYRETWPGGFGFPDRLLKAAASAASAGAVVAKAALAPRPRDRYRPGFRNRLNTRLLTMLPTRVTDRVKTGIVGMAGVQGPRIAATDPIGAAAHDGVPRSDGVVDARSRRK